MEGYLKNERVLKNENPYYAGQATAGIGSTEKKQSAADEMYKYACTLAERTEQVAAMLLDRLRPVMVDSGPEPERLNKPMRNFPPLFEGMRNSFDQISQSLDRIQDAISRTDI